MGNLWGPSGFPIPHIGLCGEYNQGKSLWGATIDPEHTLIIDLEDSTASFAHTMPIKKRLSLYEELNKKFEGKMPSDVDAFIWFRDTIEAVKPGEYSVCFVDPINDIESGLENLIRTKPGDFGLTAKQITDAPGLIWGAMNRYWKYWLGVQSQKFESFVFTTHMGNVWDGGRPIKGKRKSKGKSVLKEIASLFVLLKRETDAQNILNKIPTGFVAGDNCKERMAVWDAKTRSMVTVLPPRIENCTPDTIRQFIANPVGLRKYTKEELLPPDKPMSDDEKLQIQVEIAENQRATEEAKLMSMQMIADAAKTPAFTSAASTVKQEATEDPVGETAPVEASVNEPSPSETEAVSETESVTPDVKKEPEVWLKELDEAMAKNNRVKTIDLVRLGIREIGYTSMQEIAVLEKRGAKTWEDLTDEQLLAIKQGIAGKLVPVKE